MRIVLIGRGRLATNLQHALLSAGHEVVSINSRTLEALPAEADIFVVAVKDAALADVIRAATKGRENQLFVHTAGSMPMDIFKGLTVCFIPCRLSRRNDWLISTTFQYFLKQTMRLR